MAATRLDEIYAELLELQEQAFAGKYASLGHFRVTLDSTITADLDKPTGYAYSQHINVSILKGASNYSADFGMYNDKMHGYMMRDIIHLLNQQ